MVKCFLALIGDAIIYFLLALYIEVSIHKYKDFFHFRPANIQIISNFYYEKNIIIV